MRGTNKALFSTGTTAEYTPPLNNGITAFNSNGVNIGGYENINANNVTFVAWCWDAGEGDAVTNTAGSITSSVRANATAGFSIVTYTGNGTSNATVGHGLGVTPGMIIVKNRSSATNWPVYDRGYASPGVNDQAYLDLTSAATGAIADIKSVGSATFALTNWSGVNANGSNYVAYCWAAVPGLSSFGSYVGNGSSDGPFVFTGMRPRWLLVKRTSSTGNWNLFDTSRSDSNLVNKYLLPNDPGAEFTFSFGDILSNGFKLRDTSADWNASGATYVYAAFAEAPLNYARAR